MARPALHLAVAILLGLLPGLRVLCTDTCLVPAVEPSPATEPACHAAHDDDGRQPHSGAPGSETGCDHDDVSRARPALNIGPDRVDTLAADAPLAPPVAFVPFVGRVITDHTPSPAAASGGFLPPLRC